MKTLTLSVKVHEWTVSTKINLNGLSTDEWMFSTSENWNIFFSQVGSTHLLL